ncbi:hypothetical protein WA588_005215 [Blastocystis sp. NMH]
MEAGLDKKDTLEDVNRKVEALRASGRLETMLKRIGIDANGHFVEGRKHACTIPPTMTQLNQNEVSLWSFSWMPAIDSFDEKGLHDGHTFNELLATNRLYKNPYACHNMVLLYDINEYSSLCCDFSFPPEQNYERIRAVQNQKWAEQRLLRGVEYAKEGKFAEAVRCYSEAIDLVPKYAEAYTARGAALVKMGKYKESVTNFETALHIDEKTPNAKQYLERALAMQQGRPSIRTSELLTPAPALKPRSISICWS